MIKFRHFISLVIVMTFASHLIACAEVNDHSSRHSLNSVTETNSMASSNVSFSSNIVSKTNSMASSDVSSSSNIISETNSMPSSDASSGSNIVSETNSMVSSNVSSGSNIVTETNSMASSNVSSNSNIVSETNSMTSSNVSSSSNIVDETKGRKVSEIEWKESLNDLFSNWIDKYVGNFTLEASNNEIYSRYESVIDGAHNKMFLEEHSTYDNYDGKSKIYRVMDANTLSMKEYFCGRDGNVINTSGQWIINHEYTYATKEEMKEDFLYDSYAYNFYTIMEDFKTTQFDLENDEKRLIIDAYSSFTFDETTGIYSAFSNQNIQISFVNDKIYISTYIYGDITYSYNYTSFFINSANHELTLSDEDMIGITNAIKREDFESKN